MSWRFEARLIAYKENDVLMAIDIPFSLFVIDKLRFDLASLIISIVFEAMQIFSTSLLSFYWILFIFMPLFVLFCWRFGFPFLEFLLFISEQ